MQCGCFNYEKLKLNQFKHSGKNKLMIALYIFFQAFFSSHIWEEDYQLNYITRLKNKHCSS